MNPGTGLRSSSKTLLRWTSVPARLALFLFRVVSTWISSPAENYLPTVHPFFASVTSCEGNFRSSSGKVGLARRTL